MISLSGFLISMKPQSIAAEIGVRRKKRLYNLIKQKKPVLELAFCTYYKKVTHS